MFWADAAIRPNFDGELIKIRILAKRAASTWKLTFFTGE